jgi:nitrite reductase/ring-hydroxylating ferredoxin subunit
MTSWFDRRRGRHVRGAAATALGYAITAAAGYLGANLVYRAGTGVDRSGSRLTSSERTPVLAASALGTDTPQRVEAAGGALVLLRDGERIVAVGERCPHMGAPMADGWIDRGRVVCPWHGSAFEPATGQVQRGPATAPLPWYPTRVREGVIEVRGTVPGPVQLTGEPDAS